MMYRIISLLLLVIAAIMLYTLPLTLPIIGITAILCFVAGLLFK